MRRLALCLCVASFATACGPIQSTAWLLDSEKAIAEARAAKADTRAVYEWTRANLYYDKAREEAGYSDFEQAVDYAKKSHAAALKALELSKASPARAVEPAGP